MQEYPSVKGEPTCEAVAITGQGVFDTLKEVAKLVLADLKKTSKRFQVKTVELFPRHRSRDSSLILDGRAVQES